MKSCYEDDCFEWALTSDIDQPILDLLALTVSIGGSICQVWCSGIQGIYAQLMGVHLLSLV